MEENSNNENKMVVSDLFGLGKILPLEKLIGVLQSGVGRISKSYFYRQDADAKAYEIKKLAEARAEEAAIMAKAISKTNQITGGIQYSDEKVSISSPKQPKTLAQNSDFISPNLEQRTQQRLNYQAAIKQLNVESVTSFAAEELKDVEPVTDEPIDADWISRFFNIVEDVSNEDMQALWGKILAGEVKKPKTFSLRTLDLLRNLSQEEAVIFNTVAHYAVSNSKGSYIFKGIDNWVLHSFNISFSDILLLMEAGILSSSESGFATYNKPTKPDLAPYVFGSKVLVISRNEESECLHIPMYFFTSSGSELLKLVTINPPFEYVKALAKTCQSCKPTKIQYGDFLGFTDGKGYYENLVDLQA